MELKSQTFTSSPQTSSSIGIPVAIVIAGGLIAAALYFGGGSARMQPATVAGTAEIDGQDAGDVPAQPEEPAVGDLRAVTTDDHIRGPHTARITLVEYSDLECPFCQRFHPTLQQLVAEYPDDVRWVYRHAPLAQLHSKAPKEAEAVECAGEQGKFWELTDKIFEVSPANNGLNLDTLPQLAQDVGVPNISQFQTCLDTGTYAQHVQDDLTDAQAAGLLGTPYSVVLTSDGKKIPISGAQPYASVKQVVEDALRD